MTRGEYGQALTVIREWVEGRLGYDWTERGLGQYRRFVASEIARVPAGVKLGVTNWKNRIAVLEAIRDGAEVVSDEAVFGSKSGWTAPGWGSKDAGCFRDVVLRRPADPDEDLI